ncbi:hypothetical protein FCG67_16935 [Rhodococcus oryzae]|uniref:DUF6779 domain-containing protein n=1 Tax=Rhodococcus oryzae TaxID=2571143 RepID=A0ABY2RJM4_9NOCA|nr:DUF6779 domain-containing protein [Rhodococcus oryzae]TJZ76406.1 hypothetical protein FCG67_16935 [Rhodococcus oryzae]
MTVSGRAGSLRRYKRSTSQMFVAALVALAVIASLFMIFSNSVQLLRVGLVVALWAAVIAAIAMTKYRRESAADKAKVRDLQTVYELQLEREITARREYEMGVEAKVRDEANLDVSEIAALRAELAALRGSLEVLFEGRLPVDRVALQADATRIPELASPARPKTFTPDPAYSATPGARPTFATPDDDPVTAEVMVVGEPEPEPAASAEAFPIPRQVPPPRPAPQPAAPQPAATQPPPAPMPPIPVPEPVPPAPEPAPLPEPEPVPVPEPTPTPTDEVSSRRARRRAAESEPAAEAEGEQAVPAGAHSTGLSVAEIMANMKTAEPETDGPRSGRRRRD